MKTTKDNNNTTKPKVKYKVRNWSKYNKSLIMRGSIRLWIPDDIVNWWYGYGKNIYSDRTIEFMLTIKAVYKLPLRQVVGFVRSVFKQAGIELLVPDYSTISRRAQKLDVQLRKTNKVITDIIVDSTGVKVYGEGEWKVRKHGWSYRRTWKKIHIGIDSNGEIRCVAVTHSDIHDMIPIKQLLDQETAQITDFYGDGAYDKAPVYRALRECGAIGYHIPPQHNAKITQKSNHYRNQNIRDIQSTDRDTWKQQTGYHTRSLGETIMYRYKTTFGQHLSFRTEKSQLSEITTKCNILNTFHHLCEIDSYVITP